MMKSVLLTIIAILGFIVIPELNISTNAQTQGTLWFSTSTTSSGGYSPEHLVAVWIENSSGAFIKTKIAKSKTNNYDHLSTWTSKSNSNVVDAVSGATLSTHGTLSFTWNGTNVAGNQVADGVYTVWVEMAWASNMTTGKTLSSFNFTKKSAEDHQTPANLTNFSNTKLDWMPLGSVPSITTNPLALFTYCAGTMVNVDFFITGGSFDPGNTFTAQLSNSNGSFASPINIGTLISSMSGTINSIIPAGTPYGTAYRIRVVADQPSVVGDDNGTDLTISELITPSINVTQTPSGSVCPGKVLKFKATSVNGGSPAYLWKVDGINSGTTDSLINIFKNNQSVVCQLTTSLECVSSANVSSTPIITSIYTVDPVTITQNSGVLTSSAASGNQWFESINGIINNAAGASYTPTADGDYYVIVTNSHGCLDTSNTIHFIFGSVDKRYLNESVNIYPNPSPGLIHLESNFPLENYTLRVENLLGETVMIQSENSFNSIDLTGHPTGVYFVVLNIQNKELRFKVILTAE